MGRIKSKPALPHYAATLRRLRESRGLSTLQLAQAAGLAHETVRYLESGRREPTYRVLVALAAFFEVSPREFFPEE